MRRMILASLGLGVVAWGLSSGCSVAGDRATSGCPTGELCSDWTPDGLHFVGAARGDLGEPIGVSPTAIGGTQTIRVLTTADIDGPEFGLGFDAVSVDPSVFEVRATVGSSVGVEGVDTGSAHLRLLEPGTDLLLDRVSVQVGAIEDVALVPRQIWLTETPESWALWAGSTVDVVVRLSDAAGASLVDEGLSASGADLVRPTAWDTFELSADTAGTSAIHVEAGDVAVDFDVAVVDTIDAFGSGSDAAIEIEVGRVRTLCFVASSAGVTVYGLDASFEATGMVEVEQAADGPTGPCVTVTALAEGAGTVTAMAADRTTTRNITVIPEPTAGSSSEPLLARGSATAGERAAGN